MVLGAVASWQWNRGEFYPDIQFFLKVQLAITFVNVFLVEENYYSIKSTMLFIL